MSSSGGYLVSEMTEMFAKREIVTVRCAHCKWSRTGFAVRISRSGRDVGVLAAQRHHVSVCEAQRIARNARQKRSYDRAKEQGKRRDRYEYHKDYYAANAIRIQERRKVNRFALKDYERGGNHGRDHTQRQDAD